MAETYLVTGACGFIGARVTELLLDEGHRVVGFDNLNDAYDIRLKEWRLAQLQPRENFRYVQGDVEDADGVFDLVAEVEPRAIINLAARAGVRASMENPGVYLRTNVGGLLNILEAMRRLGVMKLVLASTSALYAGCEMPFTEDLPVNHPISPYAASKKAAEVLASTYHHLYSLDISILRYFTVFGPAGRPDMSPLRFLKWIDEGTPIELFGDGSQSRDFTYVDDIARGTVAALRPLGFETINLGGGQSPITIRAMIEAFAAELGQAPVIDQKPFNPSDMLHTQADIRKARRLLDWEPRTPPREGFRRTAAWYREHRAWLRQLKF